MSQILATTPTRTVTSARDALKYLGLLITVIAGIGQITVGARIGQEIALNTIYVMNYGLILASGLAITLFGTLALFRERIKFKVNISWYAALVLADLIISIFLAPENSRQAQVELQNWNVVGISGVLFILVAIRPNFGPEANKRIYQATAGIFAFIVAIFMFILGFWLRDPLNTGMLFDIRNYAGRGTFPGDFYNTYIIGVTGGEAEETYNKLIGTGEIMMWAAIAIMLFTILKSRIGLLVSAIGIFVSTIVYLVAISMFKYYWKALDEIFFQYPEYDTQLKIIDKDPGVFSIGMVLVILELIAFFLMVYAAFAAKPIEQWRRKRDQSIAAAEVATRQGRLEQAIKYLEAAAMWSSKIDEEDKAIELLTRVKQIKDKAIKMRKAKAAEKAKKEYEKQQKALKRKQLRAREKTPKPKPKIAGKKLSAPKKSSEKPKKID